MYQKWFDKNKATKGWNTSEMKVCVTIPGKQPNQTKMLVKGKKNLEWVVRGWMMSVSAAQGLAAAARAVAWFVNLL